MRNARYLLSALALLLSLPGVTWAGVVGTSGTYKDGAGTDHAWSINAAHVLVWDDHPFVPVGGRFQAKSWAPGATDSDFQSDVEALATLKRCGVTDVYVQPCRGGLTGVAPAAIQRLIDRLDQEGFTYGISVNDGPQDVLTGFDIRPGKYRNVAPEEGGMSRFPIEKAVSALYFLVSGTGSDVITSGSATMVAEGARVVTGPAPGKNVLFVLPVRAHFPSEGFGLPNLWDGFDAYRDSLIALFRQVKLGKGFRFFVDPLPASLDLSEEANAFIPTSAAFSAEWGAWLARKYKTIDHLADAWALTDRNLNEFHAAAALIPLWGGGKGMEALYDRTATPERSYPLNSLRSEYWKDLTAFKAESVRNYMNDLATVLKKTVADVPVVYRSRGYSALFTGLPAGGGFDGIGVDAYGRGADLVTRSAAYVYAQAAEAPKTMWIPVVATADAGPAEKTAVGYASRTALHADLDWLRDIGARGFYVDSVRAVDPARKLYDLSASDEQLTWLADYARVLAVTGVSGGAPPAVFYPIGLQYASLAAPKKLPEGAWWLPTERPYFLYDFGVAGKAYSLADSDGGMTYYLWNPGGTRTITLKVPKAADVPGAPLIAASPSAQPIRKKDKLTLTIGPDPIRLANYPIIPVPEDAFDLNYKEVKRLAGVLRQQSSLDAGRFEMESDRMKLLYNKDNPWLSVTEIMRLVDSARALLRPYAWLEAERAVTHNFDQVNDRLGVSGGRVLLVDKRPVGTPTPTATYVVNVRTPGAYHVWVAASPGASLTFRMDGHALLDDASLAKAVGQPYADGTLIWTHLGVSTLTKGSHALEMRADGPAAVDVILLTRGEFVPDGATPPPINP
jgi:hypothetical protein